MKQGRKSLPYDKQKEARNVFAITMIISMFFSFLNVSAYSDGLIQCNAVASGQSNRLKKLIRDMDEPWIYVKIYNIYLEYN